HLTDVNGANRAGIRWYDLRDANDGNWSIYQQGTYSPDAASRFIASIAMDMNGNIGLAYSYTDAANNLYPGLRYTGRYANDPLGQMTVPEEVAQTGGAAQTGINRYGDYAHMSLDPNGTTFWFTGEYLSTNGSPRTRIFSFDLQSALGVSNLDQRGPSLSALLNGPELQLTLSGAPVDGPLTVDLIGLDGRVLRTQQATSTGGTCTTKLDLTGLAAAVYFARIGDASFQRVQRIALP
ncbi:MAG: T9SS type A sorting domain-containing protein, partial [Flavobacteriales bacterium]|nr:T9SS type A sorting domain-containing protein [Flavobacteriales bacterium]